MSDRGICQAKTAHLDAIHYFASGQHLFIASDELKALDQVVGSIRRVLEEKPLAQVDGSGISDLGTFEVYVSHSCSDLLRKIDAEPLGHLGSMASQLSYTQHAFRQKRRQGYLIVNHIDQVIELQSVFEIEGPFREVMQFHSDVAIALLGSRAAVAKIQTRDRPFFLSHRTFWL